jgi:hypothetical protein
VVAETVGVGAAVLGCIDSVSLVESRIRNLRFADEWCNGDSGSF